MTRGAGPSGTAGAPARGLQRWSERLAALRGWRRLAAAAFFGALSAAALPPVHAVPVLLVAFPALLWQLDGAERWRSAASTGWAFGFGHFLAGLYWVGAAFLVDPDRHAAMAPFAVFGLAAGMGLFPMLAAVALHRAGLRRRAGAARVFLFAGLWLGAEWLRSWVLTGFPWNLIGTVWAFSDTMLQPAALAGVWGLSWITVVAASAPAALVAPTARSGRWLCGAAVSVLAVLAVWGSSRLGGAPPVGEDAVPDVKLRLVQPNIRQSLKWREGFREGHVADQMRLGLRPGFEEVTHVIWAETAVPFNLSQEAALRRDMAAAVPAEGLLIAGAPRSVRAAGQRRLWNALHAMDRDGEIVATYDKASLVPFGEYMPLRSLPGLAKLTAGGTDFSPGPGPVTLSLPGLPAVAPLICYEVIFPDRGFGQGERPQWMLTITNDAWFGITSGPHQHFASARLRAVEQGLPLVRVANSGISGVVDGLGRVWQSLGLEERGIIDSALPKGLAAPTPYAALGKGSVLILMLASLAAGSLGWARARIP